MKKNCFVTLFNSRYLSRGLVMYESLMTNMKDFALFIIAFDDKVYRKLEKLALKNVVLISLQEFEDEELLQVKKDRTRGEYCWTCSSKSILYVLEKYDVSQCTYIDADLYFFDDPSCLIEELENNNDSVLITEHRYSDYCDQSETSGKYCVQFVTVKKTEEGMKILKWWADRCIEWCYGRCEDGKFGDQKYLDSFCSLFTGVHELQNLGGGVAPWNVSQYTFSKKNNKVFLQCKNQAENTPLVFYHFHALQFFEQDVVHLTNSTYIIPDTAVTYIYKEYIKATEKVCVKYKLQDEKECWKNEGIYNNKDMDALMHDRNFYHYSLFL